METASAKTVPGRPPAPSHPPPWRQLWQGPVFVLGVLAVVLLILVHPTWTVSRADLLEQDLHAALAALEAGDHAQATALARRALEQVHHAPQLAGDLRFVLGSAALLEAAGASGAEQAAAYRRAHADLRQAEQLGVSAPHRPRLAYRLVLADYHTGGDPARVAVALEKALDISPADRVEGYALLTALHLRGPEPDLLSALRANEKLLAQPNLTDPNPARLQRGELLVRLGRGRDARQILNRIPAGAPEFAAARHVRALSWYQDEEWQTAAALWEEALSGPDRPPHAGEALYHLGLCYTRLQRPFADIEHVWGRITREMAGSPEALAVAFHLAELHLAAGRDAEALAAFTTALAAADLAAGNRYLSVAAMRQTVEWGWSRWVEAGRYDLARQLAERYRRLAAPGEADRRLALASAAAGHACLRDAERAAGPAADALRQQARQHFHDAGEAFEAVAAAHAGQPEQGEALWASAENFLRAQRYARAAVLLERYLALDLPEKRRLEALVGLGEAYQALRHTDKAVELLKLALSQPSPLQTRARYLLALTQIDQGRYAEAEANLRAILHMPVLDAEPGELRQSFFTLGRVLFQREQYAEAALQLKSALERYPNAPQALPARYWLAAAYRQAARQEERNISAAAIESARQTYRLQKTTRLEQALDQFQRLAFDLADRRTSRPLTGEEETLFRESRFGIGECLFALARYDEAVSVYETLAREYADRAEGLRALVELAYCHLMQKQIVLANMALERARTTLGRLDDQALEPTRMTRRQWQELLDQATKYSQPAP